MYATTYAAKDAVLTVMSEGESDDFDEISYSLRLLPDTNEVVLLKGDEAVYSELLDA